MDTILNKLYTPYLSQLGLNLIDCPNDRKQCGYNYKLDPSIGTGDYWVYPVGNLFGIAVFDLDIKKDLLIDYKPAPILCIGNYETSPNNILLDEETYIPKSLKGYVGNDIYRQRLNKDMYIKSVSITLSPCYYKEYLSKKYSLDYNELIDIIYKLNKVQVVPEILTVLKQIRAFKPSKEIAQMYYESKVMELISLIIQWGKTQILFENHIPDFDRERIEAVIFYINQYYAQPISLDILSKIACMSHNKLSNLFKQIYGSTITEYVQSLRINKAKELLLNSDYKIGEIANTVGYKLHGSFSELFKRNTGLTPNEFRKTSP